MGSPVVVMLKLRHFALTPDSLALLWDNGEEDYIPFKNLRLACPCAACQGEPDVLGRVVLPLRVKSEGAVVLQASIMGSYALHLIWSDGHRSGFYSFDLLKKIAQHSD